jgi:hypothetical protein
MISRCLAFSNPDLLVVRFVSLSLPALSTPVTKLRKLTSAPALPKFCPMATDQRRSQISSAYILAYLPHSHFRNWSKNRYHSRQRHFRRKMRRWSLSSLMVLRWWILLRGPVVRRSRSTWTDCGGSKRMSSRIGWWLGRRRGGCYMLLGRPLCVVFGGIVGRDCLLRS